MIGVAETHAKRRRLFRRANEPPELMTRAARRDVASARRLRTRSVTAKTRHMRIHARRDRKRNTAATASMATATVRTRMLRMIEQDIKTPQRRKRFHLSTLRVGMADRTDLTSRICELLLVTTRARRMIVLARQRRLRGVVGATMTKQTRQPRMLRIVVFELRVIRLRKHPRLARASRKNDDYNENYSFHLLGFGIALT